MIFCNNSDLGRQGVTSSVKDYCKMTQYVGKLLLILILVLKVALMTSPVRFAVMCAMQN